MRVMETNTRKLVKQTLGSTCIEAEFHINDKIVSDSEERAFVKEHLDAYIEHQWSFMAERIS